MSEEQVKYHINPDTGRPNKCTASIQDCKYAEDGQPPEHYTTKDEARKAYEKQNEKDTVKSLNKNSETIDSKTKELEEAKAELEHNIERVNKAGNKVDLDIRVKHYNSKYNDGKYPTKEFNEDQDKLIKLRNAEYAARKELSKLEKTLGQGDYHEYDPEKDYTEKDLNKLDYDIHKSTIAINKYANDIEKVTDDYIRAYSTKNTADMKKLNEKRQKIYNDREKEHVKLNNARDTLRAIKNKEYAIAREKEDQRERVQTASQAQKTAAHEEARKQAQAKIQARKTAQRTQTSPATQSKAQPSKRTYTQDGADKQRKHHSRVERINDVISPETKKFPIRKPMRTTNVGTFNPASKDGNVNRDVAHNESYIIAAREDGSRARVIFVDGDESYDNTMGRSFTQEKINKNSQGVTKDLYVVGYVNKAGEQQGYIPDRKIQAFDGMF